MRMSRLACIVVALGVMLNAGSYGQSLDNETPVLVRALAKQLVAKQRPKVAALDFTDIQGRPNELGRFLAEQMTVDMVMAEGITVIDRANINAIMAEHQLTAEGLVKPENAKKLGQFAGVDAILIGTVTIMDNTVMLTIRGISTETAEVVAAGRMRFSITKDIQSMLGMSVNSSVGISSSITGSEGRSLTGKQGDAIATREVGALTIVLRNVTLGTFPMAGRVGSGSTPQIQATFDLQNNDLQRSLAIAANQNVKKNWNSKIPSTTGYRGGLVDSLQQRWLIPMSGLSGISAVYCFEAVASNRDRGSEITQNNPTAIVNYIRRGLRYDFGRPPASGMHWAGGFTTIAPGKTLRLTLTFVPAESLAAEQGRLQMKNPMPANFQHDLALVSYAAAESYQVRRRLPQYLVPEYFQLDFELIIGTFVQGEEPEKSKDLEFRNLTIDQIALPKPTAK